MYQRTRNPIHVFTVAIRKDLHDKWSNGSDNHLPVLRTEFELDTVEPVEESSDETKSPSKSLE